jgi:ferrochelatase
MKIETLTNLISGELLNRPYISEVLFFTTDVDEVNRGSCFFAKKTSDITQAIKNGAYAIIIDKDVAILDKEIAWIKVDDFKKAIFNIFKYENLKNKIFVTDSITFEIIEKMNQDKRVVLLKNDEDFLKAINLREKFILTDKKEFLEIFKNSKELECGEINLKQIGLFKSKFEENEINLPFVYKEYFSKAYKFFTNNDLKFTLDFELDRFKPLFVDGLLREVKFGESERVVILNLKNDEFFFKELNYIVENTKHAKTVFINKHFKNYDFFNYLVCVDVEFKPNVIEEKGLFND